MSNVQHAIEEAATRFAHEIVSLLRGATLADILELTGRKGPTAFTAAPSSPTPRRRGRPPAADRSAAAEAPSDKPRHAAHRVAGRKRSRDEVSKLAERVLAFLATTRGDVGVSAIAEGLRVPTAELSLPMSKLRRENKVTTTGQKRSTVYRLP